VLILVAVMGVGPVVRAQDVSEQSRDQRSKARSLFVQGQSFHVAGQHAEALRLFRAARALESAPLLTFNIAQELRLLGLCRQAFAEYKLYLKESSGAQPPQLEQRAFALRQLALLSEKCEATETEAAQLPSPARHQPAKAEPVAAQRLILQDNRASSAEPTPRAGMAARSFNPAWIGMIAGSLTLAGAGGLFVWNHDRSNEWSKEHRLLNPPDMSPSSIPDGEYRLRQINNNQLNRSIVQWERVNLGVAALGLTTVVVSTYFLLRDESPDRARLRAFVSAQRLGLRWLF